MASRTETGRPSPRDAETKSVGARDEPVHLVALHHAGEAGPGRSARTSRLRRRGSSSGGRRRRRPARSCGPAASVKASSTASGSLMGMSRPTDTTSSPRSEVRGASSARLAAPVHPLQVHAVLHDREAPSEDGAQPPRQRVAYGAPTGDDGREQRDDQVEEEPVPEPEVPPRVVHGEDEVAPGAEGEEVGHQGEHTARRRVHVHHVVRTLLECPAQRPEAAPGRCRPPPPAGAVPGLRPRRGTASTR